MTLSTACRAASARGSAIVSLLLALVVCSCDSAEKDPIGGETHFLTCESNDDCAQLSDEYVCQDKKCRVPTSIAEPPRPDAATPMTTPDAATPMTTPDAATPMTTPDAATPMTTPDAATPMSAEAGACATGTVDPSEVVILGDSFFGTTHEITTQLEQLATAATSASTDVTYRDYSRLMDNALAFMGNGIAGQYSNAKDEGDVQVAIMNGGGADALLGTCATVDAQCPLIVAAAAAAEALLAQMASDGVTDVVYAFYPDAPGDIVRAKVDLLRPLIRDVCDNAPTRCHWVDLRPVFDGHYDEFIGADGLNPTVAGSQAAAAAIWSVMQQDCVAQ
jgi:hypothetical protein